MPIRINNITRHVDGTPGDHAEIVVGETQIIVDTGSAHPGTPDIRVTDQSGSGIYKFMLNADDYSIQQVLKDDRPLDR